jgi:hypothetical protein
MQISENAEKSKLKIGRLLRKNLDGNPMPVFINLMLFL